MKKNNESSQILNNGHCLNKITNNHLWCYYDGHDIVKKVI